jgi:hypothetical protein
MKIKELSNEEKELLYKLIIRIHKDYGSYILFRKRFANRFKSTNDFYKNTDSDKIEDRVTELLWHTLVMHSYNENETSLISKVNILASIEVLKFIDMLHQCNFRTDVVNELTLSETGYINRALNKTLARKVGKIKMRYILSFIEKYNIDNVSNIIECANFAKK